MMGSCMMRTDNVDIETEVYWTVSDTFANAPNDLSDTNVVNVICRDQLKPNFLIVL
jgi:hypothetical protein